jgi:hypothetical protein
MNTSSCDVASLNTPILTGTRETYLCVQFLMRYSPARLTNYGTEARRRAFA